MANKYIVLFGFCVLLLGSLARADEFNLTATGPGLSLTATVDGTPSGTPGVFDLTDFVGSVNGQTASLLPTPSPGGFAISPTVDGVFFGYDNVLLVNSPFLDLAGIGLLLSDGDISNLFVNTFGPDGYFELEPSGLANAVLVDVTVTPAPEPASFPLLGMGVVAICIWNARRRAYTF